MRLRWLMHATAKGKEKAEGNRTTSQSAMLPNLAQLSQADRRWTYTSLDEVVSTLEPLKRRFASDPLADVQPGDQLPNPTKAVITAEEFSQMYSATYSGGCTMFTDRAPPTTTRSDLSGSSSSQRPFSKPA